MERGIFKDDDEFEELRDAQRSDDPAEGKNGRESLQVKDRREKEVAVAARGGGGRKGEGTGEAETKLPTSGGNEADLHITKFWRTDGGAGMGEGQKGNAGGSGDETDSAPRDQEIGEGEKRSFLERMKQKKAAILAPMAGLLLAGTLIHNSIGGVKNGGGADAGKAQEAAAGFPEPDLPPVSQDQISPEEVQRRMIEAGEAEKRREAAATKAEKERIIRIVAQAAMEKKAKEKAEAPAGEAEPEKASRSVVTQRRARSSMPAAPPQAPVAPPAPPPPPVKPVTETDPVAQPPRRRLPAEAYATGIAIVGRESGGSGAQADAGGSKAIPPGTTFGAALQVGINTSFGAPVIAQATDPVEIGGTVVLPTGSTLQGSASSSEDRIFVNFSRVTTPDGKRLSLRGYAVSGKLPGIPARVVKQAETATGSGGSAIGRGALRTAEELVGTVTGGVAQDLTRNVAEESLSDVRQQGTGRMSGNTLELPAGARFQVVVTGGE